MVSTRRKSVRRSDAKIYCHKCKIYLSCMDEWIQHFYSSRHQPYVRIQRLQPGGHEHISARQSVYQVNKYRQNIPHWNSLPVVGIATVDPSLLTSPSTSSHSDMYFHAILNLTDDDYTWHKPDNETPLRLDAVISNDVQLNADKPAATIHTCLGCGAVFESIIAYGIHVIYCEHP